MLLKRFFGFLVPRRRRVHGDQIIYTKNASQISFLIHISCKKGVTDSNFWNQITKRVIYLTSSLNANNLSYISYGLAKAGILNKDVWESIITRYYHIQNDCNQRHCSLIANAVAKVHFIDINVIKDICTKLLVEGQRITPRYLAILLNGIVIREYRDHNIIERLLQLLDLANTVDDIASLAILLNNLYELDHCSKATLFELSRLLTVQLNVHLVYNPNCAAKSSSNELLSTKSMINRDHQHDETLVCFDGFNTPDGATGSIEKRLPIEKQPIGGKPKTRITQHLAIIHRAYSHFHYFNRELFDLLFKIMALYHRSFKPPEVVMIAHSMGISKLHNADVVSKFTQQLLKRPKLYTVDMAVVFLNGICRNKHNDNESMRIILGNILSHKYCGTLSSKHSLTALKVMSKIEDKELQNSFIIHIMNNLQLLDGLELANSVLYAAKLQVECMDYDKVVNYYLSTYSPDDHIKNAQHVAIMYYGLSLTSNNLFDKYKSSIIDLIDSIPINLFEPVNIANILKVMATKSLFHADITPQCCHYLASNIKRFNTQLLVSAIQSLHLLQAITDSLWLELCLHAHRIKKVSINDNIIYLNVILTEATNDRMRINNATAVLIEACKHLTDLLSYCLNSTNLHNILLNKLQACEIKLRGLKDDYSNPDFQIGSVISLVLHKIDKIIQMLSK